jgi:hypothetical protein
MWQDCLGNGTKFMLENGREAGKMIMKEVVVVERKRGGQEKAVVEKVPRKGKGVKLVG